MLSSSALVANRPANFGLTVMLASPDALLVADLQEIFTSMGLRVITQSEDDFAIDAMRSLEDEAIVLLDVRLKNVANGRLLAAMHESGVHKRCAIALIADQVSDEWIARLREGAIDDIVPRSSDVAAWRTHLSSMQRGHDLYCELEHLREAALLAVQHDRVTGVFNRETMLTILFRETDRVQRLRGVLSLILLDIDDFGHWTEALGKESCNALLREVTVRTGRILRSYDLLGRMGNDEFLLALPGCSTINAVMMAERLRVEVFGDPFLVKDGQKQTVSVRLTACFAVCASRGRSPVVILREAEQTLAITKQSGPDTIRCTGESQLPNEAYSTLARLFPETEILT